MGEPLFRVSPAKIFARPTADRIWLGPAQQAALSRLSSEEPCVALLGPSSSGKSSLLNYLVARIEDAVVLKLSAPLEDACGVLAQVLASAEMSPWELSAIDQRNLFTVFLQQRVAQGRSIVITVDDAHLVGAAAWDEINRLRLLRIADRPALRLICSADSEHGASPPFKALLQDAATTTYNFPHLADSDVAAYIQWRLAQFDLSDLFTGTAARLIAKVADGRYTAVDVLCQMSLLLLRQRGHGRVDAPLVQKASSSLAERYHRHGGPITSRPAEPAAQPGRIIATRDGSVVMTHALGERVLIGRSEHNDLCLPSPYLSRHHAVIVGTSDGYYVVDLNSVNGLLLNGNLVRRAVLNEGDVLGLGPFRLKVELFSTLRRGDPIPAGASLDDTGVMPPQPSRQPPIRVIK